MGSYELLEIVGKGGMGTVHRAVHIKTGQVVAVKLMAMELSSDPILLRRFEQECSAASRLRHPHIVQGLDFELEGKQPYLVMEFVEGQNLGQRVRQQGPLSEAEGVRLLAQVADALQLAHEHRLVHRDVKPDNILVTKHGQAKLTDLGLIKDLDAGTNLTRPRAGLGTIIFTAPEQFGDAEHADARCDVYGLGATLYYALTGVVPFLGRGNLTVLQKKLRNEFVPPRQIVPSLRGAVDGAIRMALDVSPSKRPSSCREFAAMLLESDAGDEWPASRSSGSEQRRVRRFPSGLSASCQPPRTSGEPCKADVQDVSLAGMCLQLDRPFDIGAVFKVEVVDEKSGPVALSLVRVCWVREVSANKWNVGCAFDRELTDDELITLLENKAPTLEIQAGESFSLHSTAVLAGVALCGERQE